MAKRYCLFLFFLLLSITLPMPSIAAEDSVMKTIEDAIQHYKDGKFTAAVTSLDYASQMIRQKKGEALGRLLPDPLPGWTSQQADGKATGTAIFGGATTAERHYMKSDATISVRYSSDSPMMQTMTMMFSNPLFASSSGKLELINGQKAIVDYKETSGNVNIVIGSNLLITVEGNNVKKEDLMAYADKIDMDKLTKLP